jgi:hypothetical protein
VSVINIVLSGRKAKFLSQKRTEPPALIPTACTFYKATIVPDMIFFCNTQKLRYYFAEKKFPSMEGEKKIPGRKETTG